MCLKCVVRRHQFNKLPLSIQVQEQAPILLAKSHASYAEYRGTLGQVFQRNTHTYTLATLVTTIC